MPYVATCTFREPAKSYYLNPCDLELHVDSRIVAETARGLELGKVKFLPREVDAQAMRQPARAILRLATPEDLERYEENLRWEEESVFAIRDRILYLGLPMKPIKCEAMLDRSRMFFFYESEGRIDFRELLRDVSTRLNVRLQFQQVNAREAAQVLGGVGICGRELCCATWLQSTPPITLKMAKEQGMSLTPSKISGVCGRLMCCLRYETEFYRDQNMKLPPPGSPVDTPEGPGHVVNVNVFTEECLVELGDGRRISVSGDDLRSLREERGEVHACKNSVKNGGSCNGAAVGKSCGTGGCGKDGGCGCTYMKGSRMVALTV
ncbi:MAG TPA: regulatory iron-sulfur-containing complex subunit RicT [Abditibacteriaceae bacterium]|nr:regulatory iron-sulfur-containing complex subunit RicT [Abditibacteriaceae bacterium]